MNVHAEHWQGPRCIHLAGADGSGKTTQARALLALLQEEGVPARTVRLRFPHLLSAPLLAYARLRGCSYREVVDGCQHGYWEFRRSWLLSHVLPWVMLLDTVLAALVRVYWPLGRGWVLVCDRFVVDVLVDLMVGLGDASFDTHNPGRLFFRLLPPRSRVVIVDLDSEQARQRCPELRGDRSHERRRTAYLDVAHRHGLPVVSNRSPVDITLQALVDVLQMPLNSDAHDSGIDLPESAGLTILATQELA